MSRPLLFLDVDGPLIPFGGPVPEYPLPREFRRNANPLLARVNPDLGPELLALSCELQWATSWMDDANDLVGPLLGLPSLPVVAWPDEPDETPGLHWKTRPLVDLAAGRPFVWVDDEIGDGDRRWVSEHHDGRALLHRVDHRTGLTPADFALLTAWLGER